MRILQRNSLRSFEGGYLGIALCFAMVAVLALLLFAWTNSMSSLKKMVADSDARQTVSKLNGAAFEIARKLNLKPGFALDIRQLQSAGLINFEFPESGIKKTTGEGFIVILGRVPSDNGPYAIWIPDHTIDGSFPHLTSTQSDAPEFERILKTVIRR